MGIDQPPFEQPFDTPPSGQSTNDERTWGLFAHLSFLLTYVVGFSWIAPLVIWQLKKDESAFLEDQAKEALNFQLSAFIAILVCSATCVLIPVAVVILVAATVYSVIGAMESNKGVLYRYPYTFRLIK